MKIKSSRLLTAILWLGASMSSGFVYAEPDCRPCKNPIAEDCGADCCTAQICQACPTLKGCEGLNPAKDKDPLAATANEGQLCSASGNSTSCPLDTGLKLDPLPTMNLDKPPQQ